MFSPRPARGYRFHSLQVEIITAPTELPKLQPFASNHSAPAAPFGLESECLTPKIGTANYTAINLSWMPGPVTDIAFRPPLIVAKCCSWVASLLRVAVPITRSRHRPRPLARACRTRRPEGRLPHSKK